MPNFIENYWNEKFHLWRGEFVTRFPPKPNRMPPAGYALSWAVLLLGRISSIGAAGRQPSEAYALELPGSTCPT